MRSELIVSGDMVGLPMVSTGGGVNTIVEVERLFHKSKMGSPKESVCCKVLRSYREPDEASTAASCGL